MHYYEENPVSDNSQVAGSYQVTIQSAADNEDSVNLMAPSNSDHTAVPLEEPTSQAPLDTTFFTDSQAPIGPFPNVEGGSSQPTSETAYRLCSDPSLSILFYNGRSLLPKFDELCALCENHCPGVVCIVETWLGEEITDSEISLPDYQLYRLDRNRHGGGVLMYVHKSFSCKVLLVGPSQLEFLLISIYRSCHRVNIGTFYRPPSSSVSVMDNLFSVLESLDSSYFSNFVLLGDFNIDFCNPLHPPYSKLTSLMQLFSLTQVVQGTTHSSSSGRESSTLHWYPPPHS